MWHILHSCTNHIIKSTLKLTNKNMHSCVPNLSALLCIRQHALKCVYRLLLFDSHQLRNPLLHASKWLNIRVKKSKRNTTCPICDENIKDATKYRKGDDSIYCEGYCDAWIHRRCAGLSAVNFNMLSEAEDQTFCIHCKLEAHKAEIENLMSSITEL